MGWCELNQQRQFVNELIEEWDKLVLSKLPEKDYHQFLKEHANLFLLNQSYSYFVISKLKLGSDFEVDFAIPHEQHSRGLFWELIEIEKPQDTPYKKNGTPSAALTHATQQIRDWRDWLQEHRSQVQRLFGVDGVRAWRYPNFKFTIVIGTRENSRQWIEKRNQYSNENGIEVRSFDYLGDILRQKHFWDKAILGSDIWDEENPDLAERLANPFMEAITDSGWKELLRQPATKYSHFIPRIAENLDEIWSENYLLRQRFNKLVKT